MKGTMHNKVHEWRRFGDEWWKYGRLQPESVIHTECGKPLNAKKKGFRIHPSF
jgi:hypothetical protein